MVGRAGRAGLTESGDSVLLCHKNDKDKVRKQFHISYIATIVVILIFLDQRITRK